MQRRGQEMGQEEKETYKCKNRGGMFIIHIKVLGLRFISSPEQNKNRLNVKILSISWYVQSYLLMGGLIGGVTSQHGTPVLLPTD